MKPVPWVILADTGFVEGQLVRWEDTTLSLSPHQAWFHKRVDAVTIDASGGFHVYDGQPSLWSQVPPETPTSQLLLTAVTRPSRLEGLVQRLVQVTRRPRISRR